MSCESGTCAPLPQVKGSQTPADEENSSASGPPLGSSQEECTSDFECSLDEQCKQGKCVPAQRSPLANDTAGTGDQAPQDTGTNWLAITLIALGLIVMGGGGFYLRAQSGTGSGLRLPDDITKAQAWEQTPRMPPPLPKGTPGPTMPPLSPREASAQVAQQRAQAQQQAQQVQQAQDRALERERLMEQAGKRMAERSERRHEAFRAFDTQQGAPVQQARAQPSPPKDGPSGKQAAKAAQAKAAKKDGEEGDDVFDRLEKL
jgi:hypothetical protein